MAREGSGTTLLTHQRTTLRGKQTRLRAIANGALDAVDRALRLETEAIIKEAQKYPDPTGGVYERTYELQNHWQTFPHSGTATNTDGSRSIAIYNDAVDPRGRYYAIYVQGEWQTGAHEETGWQRIEDIAARHSTSQGNRVRAGLRRLGE